MGQGFTSYGFIGPCKLLSHSIKNKYREGTWSAKMFEIILDSNKSKFARFIFTADVVADKEYEKIFPVSEHEHNVREHASRCPNRTTVLSR